MNKVEGRFTRRGFLRFLAAVPVLNRIPLPAKLYGDGFDGNATISPLYWKKYEDLNLNGYKLGDGGGAAGGAGTIARIIMGEELKVTANSGQIHATESQGAEVPHVEGPGTSSQRTEGRGG